MATGMVLFFVSFWTPESHTTDRPDRKASTTRMESEHYRKAAQTIAHRHTRRPAETGTSVTLRKLSFRDRYQNAEWCAFFHGRPPKSFRVPGPRIDKSEHYRNEKRALPE